MNKTFDAIVCGGSLAGSAAAVTLARQNRSVLVLDKAEFPRSKLCGGLLTWKSVQLLGLLFGETPETMAEHGIIRYVSDRYSIRTFTSTLAEGTVSYPFHLTDRAELDNRLLYHVRRAGALVREGEEVAACDPASGEVVLKDGRTARGRYIIGADGAHSTVRAGFPEVNLRAMRRFTAATIEVKIPAADIPETVDRPILYVGFVDAGYGWVFPNGENVLIGICGLRREDTHFAKLFRSFLDVLGVDPAVLTCQRGHPLPYGSFLHDPVHANALLAGDAGGYVEPLFGEGIFYALCTGMYAGRAVAHALEHDTEPGPEYLRLLHRTILPELNGSNTLRWFLFRAMKLFGPGAIRRFVRFGAGPLGDMVHGKRSYHWLRKKDWHFPEPGA
ncbi:geranylgeranyl reductase [Pseudodesulfovibrio mercurii]|uniref:Geranylgeranyl reductase n=1 Tax=Pseudodesulfovibrio mercurii TaxID=641491 RepID=F0JC52_9BACT|nr:NAD(P)/FAD-dependent oxidoreductase [Pseudodesulfovibrio mercurii]EGB15625.1 geranylgeranyl reductase [Pseudodesulfovibrio mercurii]